MHTLKTSRQTFCPPTFRASGLCLNNPRRTPGTRKQNSHNQPTNQPPKQASTQASKQAHTINNTLIAKQNKQGKSSNNRITIPTSSNRIYHLKSCRPSSNPPVLSFGNLAARRLRRALPRTFTSQFDLKRRVRPSEARLRKPPSSDTHDPIEGLVGHLPRSGRESRRVEGGGHARRPAEFGPAVIPKRQTTGRCQVA